MPVQRLGELSDAKRRFLNSLLAKFLEHNSRGYNCRGLSAMEERLTEVTACANTCFFCKNRGSIAERAGLTGVARTAPPEFSLRGWGGATREWE